MNSNNIIKLVNLLESAEKSQLNEFFSVFNKSAEEKARIAREQKRIAQKLEKQKNSNEKQENLEKEREIQEKRMYDEIAPMIKMARTKLLNSDYTFTSGVIQRNNETISTITISHDTGKYTVSNSYEIIVCLKSGALLACDTKEEETWYILDLDNLYNSAELTIRELKNLVVPTGFFITLEEHQHAFIAILMGHNIAYEDSWMIEGRVLFPDKYQAFLASRKSEDPELPEGA